jgi:hypothetical protein
MNDSRIENAQVIGEAPSINTNNQGHINTNTGLEIYKLFYVIGLILMLVAYVGPYLYFKYYKKKNFLPGGNMGVKHAI